MFSVLLVTIRKIQSHFNQSLLKIKKKKKGRFTCKESPTSMKKELSSGGTETQFPFLREIWKPAVLFDRSTEIIWGSVCSPKPTKFVPFNASNASGFGG